MAKTKKPLEIDMIAGSQLRDTQGEMLSVEGADISELQAGRGRFNDNHGKGFFNSIGRITGAKKIFKSEDCQGDREKYYWDKVKAPFIFVKGYLYDDDDHPNARAAAAILRNIHKSDTPLQLKASVEGGVISRGLSDNSLLARTKIHSVALTFTPANNNTLVEPTSMSKSQIDEEADMLLIKSVIHLAETNVPSFRHIARDASATKVQQNLMRLTELMNDLGLDGISIPSKDQILEKSLEEKIKNNVAKIAAAVSELNKSDEKPLKTCLPPCNTKLTTKNSKYIGRQKTGDGIAHDLDLYNCPNCGTTVTDRVPKEIKKGEVHELFPEKKIKEKQKKRESTKVNKDPIHKPEPGYKYQDEKGWIARDKGVSQAGAHVRDYKREGKDTLLSDKSYGGGAFKEHKKVLSGLKAQPKPNLTKSEDMEKAGIKNALAAAGMGAAMSMAPSVANPVEIAPPKPIVQQQQVAQPSVEDIISSTSKKYPLLGAIANVESSGGKNMNHKTMTDGPHKGMTAGGPFGMMPHSAAFMLSKDPSLAKKYPKLLEASKDMEHNHKQFTDLFNKDPQAAADFAISFYNRNKAKTKNDQQLTYSWLNGLKGSWNKYKEGGQAALEGHPYVKHVMQEYSKLQPKKAQQKKPLKKAMTAGYGGGGAPTDLTGGGVIQAESLEQGRPSLKYISCDNCGKEQVHAKFQVKCRECGHSMSLEKLHNAMRSNK